MIGFQYDDGGRRLAGFRGDAGDCVVRALTIVTSGDYRSIYREVARANQLHKGTRSARNGVNRKVWMPIFEAHGLRKVKLPKGPRPTYSEAWQRFGDCIVSTTKHLAAVVDGVLRDTEDEREYFMVTPYCRECRDLDARLAGSGFDTCSVCGEKGRVGLVNVLHQRKAQSVWVP